MLSRLAGEGATGEFIAAIEGLEVHVYLQSGRVAWATTSAERFIFRHTLISDFGVDPGALSALIDDCYRTRRPVGETLVKSGLLTRDQVREGLRAQVVAALRSLDACRSPQALFLPRGTSYSAYEPSLTFPFEAVRDEAVRRPEPALSPADAMDRLVEKVPGVSWASVLGAERAMLRIRSASPPALEGLASRLGADLQLIALRSRRGAVLGCSLAGHRGHSLWCGLPAGASLSGAIKLLADFAGPWEPRGDRVAQGLFEECGETALPTQGLSQLLDCVGCSAGLVLLEPAGSTGFWSLARAPFDPCELGRVATLHQEVLEASVIPPAGPEPSPGIREPLCQGALVADRRWWWFGMSLPNPGSATAWLALPRSEDTLLGWAILESLTRVLSGSKSGNG